MGSLEDRIELGAVIVKTRLSQLYEGTSRANSQRVVVQITPIDPASRETVERTLERAAKVLSVGKIRGVAELVDWDLEAERYWVAFAQSGAPLSAALERGLSRETIVDIGIELAAGLRALKQAGLVHRSINPDVIFVTPEGGAALLGLEGMRAVGSPDVLRSGVGSNDPRYTPPEAIDYESDDIRSDVYSLGCVLFRAVGGKPPYAAADEAQTRRLHKEAHVPQVPGEPAGSGWHAAFAKLLAKRVEDRPYPEDVEALLRPLRYSGMKVADLASLQAASKRKSSAPMVVGFAVVALVLFGGVIFGMTQFGDAIASVGGTGSTPKPEVSAAGSAAASAAASAGATAAPSASPSAAATNAGPAATPRPATPAPTVAPTPPPPPPDFVTPVAGVGGTTFHFVFTGLPAGVEFRTSYSRGGTITNFNTGEVGTNGRVELDLRTTTSGTAFPPDAYVFTIRAQGMLKNVNFRILPPQ